MNSSGEAKIRLATTVDLDAILLLDRAIDRLPHWSASDYLAAISGATDGPRRCLFVAELGGELVGLGVGMVHDLTGEWLAELESVGVAGHMQRRGVGRELCRAVIAWCGSQGAVHVDLEVRRGSAGPIALYASLGFEVMGERRGYYRNPADDAVLMRLNLKAGRSEPASIAES